MRLLEIIAGGFLLYAVISFCLDLYVTKPQ